jgi:hypothetical protein
MDEKRLNATTQQRAAHVHGRTIDAYPERANLFALAIDPLPRVLYKTERKERGRTREDISFENVAGSKTVDASFRNLRQALRRCFVAGIKGAGYTIGHRELKVVRTDHNLSPAKASDSPLKIHSSFDWRVLSINHNWYLALDHRLVVRAAMLLPKLRARFPGLQLDPSQRVLFQFDGEWDEARLIEAGSEDCRLVLYTGEEVTVPAKHVVPELSRSQIVQIAPALKVSANELERVIKQFSMLTVADAPRARFDICVEFAAHIAEHVFPLTEAGVTIQIDPTAAMLRPPQFVVGKDLQDPDASFDHVDQTKRARIIFDGLTRFGAYDKPTSKIRLAVFTTPDRRVPMEQLVRRLNDGKYQYLGARKTFGSEFVVREVRTCADVDGYEDEIKQFVRTPARGETDVALLYLPAEGNTSDPQHPYYRTKALLLKEGLASQMINRGTAANLDWKDLNLALNIYAKAGNTPWVLDKPMPGADMFIGLSYSSYGTTVKRMMSYVNVFDSYGRWRFYDGDTEVFSFDDRLNHYQNVVKNAVAKYRGENGGDLQSVHIHLTKKFSGEERAVIAQAVRAEAPGASVVFVSINVHHVVRLYDLTEGGDGSIRRATYLRDDPGRLYLATTGNNNLNQKGMGTPIPLELTVWTEPQGVITDLNVIAQHILSLTRLNWASVKSFCREPITTKFAGDIAQKMTAFMEDPHFSVNSSLRGTPWFL